MRKKEGQTDRKRDRQTYKQKERLTVNDFCIISEQRRMSKEYEVKSEMNLVSTIPGH